MPASFVLKSNIRRMGMALEHLVRFAGAAFRRQHAGIADSFSQRSDVGLQQPRVPTGRIVVYAKDRRVRHAAHLLGFRSFSIPVFTELSGRTM